MNYGRFHSPYYFTLPINFYITEVPNSRPHAESGSGSESESDDEVGAQAPPLTKQISNILNRYPEGGQILKVFYSS